jgi:peptidyl-dipeptidase A
VRRKLHDKYGSRAPVGFDAFIPAHLLGDMWGQDWSNLWARLPRQPHDDPRGLDINEGLKEKYGEDPRKMVRTAESFFVGLGFEKLPETFWERSVFTQPPDRKMVCHASAWDVTYNDDLRLKACLHTTQSDFFTVHHELGHCYYFQSYYKRNIIFQNGANDGFHEAIGDTITLSLTPKYLKGIGLLNSTYESALINNQLSRALDKVAFMPFAYMVDKWRYDVFSGRVPESKYNEHWWALRQKYQGVMSPIKRSATDFDPGAKYHVAANVPYMRYFLASILQFQFHRALCRRANHTGPLHECSIAGNLDAGKALKDMLRLGASRPWQEALKELSGDAAETEMDPSAILEYFEPLMAWLTKENAGRECGWPQSAPVQPVDARSHLGIMIGLAAGAAVAIFIGAGAFNWWHSRNAATSYDKMPGRGDYDGM